MFQSFETLQGDAVQPPATEAMKLLHRLAADPGIVAIMRAHHWTVGKLSEMPPEVQRLPLLHRFSDIKDSREAGYLYRTCTCVRVGSHWTPSP